ncbi:ACT domain-containing protein ACR4-like isoform X2 [Chenopodium quinoa]|uniref:ACT domain-containing protein ACR4-like isoform X2 n=1 Tax=Chenopodium quinoa TaxID=63459 RepID=UPI000B777B9E|nr:ACT domain-containing protein ACR4-like isoform X2 [Chenopodium quinoa]
MVTSQDQNKWVIIDNDISESATIIQALAAKSCLFNSANETVEMFPHQGYTMILMSGIDRPGLLYELSEILTHHGVHIVNADLWTHKHHASAMINVVDESMGLKINDSKKLSGIKKDLGHIIKPSVKFRSPENWNVEDRSSRTRVTASNCSYRDYTPIDIRSDNRVNLLLDTISTLMVMQYVVFHGSVAVGKIKTFQTRRWALNQHN